MTALRGIAACLIIALVAVPARAQTGASQRPFRALFGGDPSNQRSLHQLDLTVSVKGGTDNGFTSPDVVPPTDPPDPASAEFSEIFLADATLAYAMRGSRVTMGATGSASFPYYSVFPETQHLAYGTGANVAYTSGPTSLAAQGSYAYSPYYAPWLDSSAGFLPGLPPNYASAVSPNETASAGASWTRRFGRETTVSAGYTASALMFDEEDRSSLNQNIRVSGSYRMSRSFSFSGGYAYGEADYSGSAAPESSSRSNSVNFGLAYSRHSSRGPGTTLAMTVGASSIEYQQQSWGWNGSVSLNQPIGANWSAGLSYSHSLQDQTLLQEPVWTDTVRATVGGRVGRRVNLGIAANYWSGNQVEVSGQRFDSYSGTARGQVAITEWAAITADYTYYRYNYPAGYDLPAGVPRQQDRHRVMLGASFWLPLARAGRARAPLSTVSQ